MNSNYFITGVVAISLMASAGAALAQGKKDGMRGMGPMMFEFSVVDTDADGKVTQGEMQAYAKSKFDAADTDNNGKLSADEMSAAAQKRRDDRRAKRVEKMVKRMDTDADGELSFDEMPGQKTRAEQMFSRVDSDGDGAISKAEMDAARDKGGRGGAMKKHQRQGKNRSD